jgi:acyl dehydratase
MAQFKWYFEDFKVGNTIELGSRTLTEEEIISFAKEYDPQPFHIDKAAAEKSMFGGIIASGWQTCGIMMRMLVDGYLREAASLGSPGVDEIRWLKPVRPGDTLSVSITTVESRPSSSKPDRGVVVNTWQATNQRGEVVATIKGMGMFLRRPAG